MPHSQKANRMERILRKKENKKEKVVEIRRLEFDSRPGSLWASVSTSVKWGMSLASGGSVWGKSRAPGPLGSR